MLPGVTDEHARGVYNELSFTFRRRVLGSPMSQEEQMKFVLQRADELR